MKKIMFACMLMAISGVAKSQTMANNDNWENSTRSATRGMVQQDNEFANTEISTEHRRVTFSDLPEL